MAERFAAAGNPAPGSNPEPGVPGPNFSVTNPMSGQDRGGPWMPFSAELEENGELAIAGNVAAGSEPEDGPMMSQAQPMCGGGWEPERFAAPGNPSPGSDPCC